jgi:P-type conjugative transfer protein TrbG
MRLFLLPAIAYSALACPSLAQDRLDQVASATRAATIKPASGSFVRGAQVYAFADDAIFEGYVTPGLVTDLALQPGEALVAVASGDTARWAVGDTTSGAGETKQTHVLVKPFAAGLVTNLVITTDRRTYHVRLVSTRGTAIAAMRWMYPQDDLLAWKRKTEAAQAAAAVAAGIAVEQLNFNYAISGDTPAWRPLRAFDDGTRTYIEFPPALASSEAPPLFIIGADGKAELVNYRLRERYYVVDRLFDAAELRLGLKKQQAVRISRSAHPGKGTRK